MPKAAPVADEFASAMQQLSAEAEKTLPAHSPKKGGPHLSAADLSQHADSVHARLDRMEQEMNRRMDKIMSAVTASAKDESAERFRKIEEQLETIRGSETVNQRLFDSLHEELLAYRDNFLHESLQKPFIHDLVHLYDDLMSLSDQLQNAAAQDGRGRAMQWRDNLENAIHSLIEILHRFEVKEIEPKENVDRAFHKVVSFEPADFAEEDGRIVMRVRRGFFWRGKLIRPEEVIAKRFG